MRSFLKYGFVFLLVLASPLKAEETVLNQLHRKLKNASLPEKVEVYNQLSAYYISSDAEKAIKYANQALKIAHSLNDLPGKARAYGNLGMGYYFLSDYDNLREYYKRSLTAYDSLGDQRGITDLATKFYRLDNSQKSLDNYKNSLLLYLNENDVKKIIATYKNMGDVHKSMGDYQIALENYLKALDYIGEQKKGYELEKTALWESIGYIWFNEEAYDKALRYYTLLHDEYMKRGDTLSIASASNNLAGVYYRKDQLNKSKDVYRQALDLQIKMNDHLGASISLLNLARIYSKLNDHPEAILLHKKSIALAKVIGSRDVQQDNYRMLAIIYSKKGDFKLAYKYQVLYSNTSGVLARAQNVDQYIRTLMVNDIEKEKRENEVLEARNENYRLRLEKENLSAWRLSFGFTILVVLILVFVIYYRYYLKREENKNLETKVKEALKKQEEQQQIIVHQASLSSLGELAAGIAHEINQPIQNISLSAEGIQFELMETTPDHAFVKKSVGEIFEDIVRVREIVDHIRIFSSGQKETVYEWFSVSECVNAAISMIRRQYQNHNIDLQLQLSHEVPDLMGNPHKVEQVIHNLLSNARDAVDERERKNPDFKKQIVIETGYEANEVFIKVRDNGAGIPHDKQTDIFLPFVTSKQLGKGTGLGLSISYSLVKEMNGRIEVQSRVMDGTIMKVIFPVDKKNINQ
ncbi:tetratricopeptide repeat protein [Saccharicrinis fermentans]|uniref:histidine kinase n=1 Tax=Saccharicrinis fermentans DSM 9555 = JCM 21142 TaxID=869213 RepID=W7XTZ2_9BACT|nr:tetratricopeptide repeat protein [Saccharicrinis fermentans]GAF01480.1 C4-dicarboxylate transport sensor protein DctB [Saccharicrinis fermentans DSM 9555 = JCM 21142]